MTTVKVFWFGKNLLKSPRAGIRPNGAAVYDERIAKDLVNSYGDLLMVTTLDQRKMLHFGKRIDPEYAAFKYPALQTIIEKASGVKIVTTVSDVLRMAAAEPLTLQDEIDQRKLHAFIGLGGNNPAPEPERAPQVFGGLDALENSDPVTTDQAATGAEVKPEDTVVDKPKRGRPKKVTEEKPSSDIQ